MIMMQKKLFTQIRNEWRSNLWLALELLVVSVVMWYIVDLLYCRMATRLEPRGFDTEHCYLLTMRELTDKSPDYRADASTYDDVLELVERLRRRPGIEAVSLSQNSYPYNGSNGSDRIAYDTLVSPEAIRRLVTPDFMRVFRYRGARGETPEQLAAALKRGEFLASENLYENKGIDITTLAGKDGFHLFGDTTVSYRLGAVLQNVRYCDYEEARFCYSFAYNLEELARYSPGYINVGNELCLRVTPQEDHDFIARLKADSESQLRVGNLYISDVRSFTDIRRNFQQGYANQLRNYLVGMGFLMLNIFLGLLGTFWFRTQQRRGEIALHKVSGATRGDILRRLVGEGLLLLAVVTPPALLVDYILANAELNSWRGGTTLEPVRLLCCAGVSMLLIALMITVGIWYPARKAMRVQPADALHDE